MRRVGGVALVCAMAAAAVFGGASAAGTTAQYGWKAGWSGWSGGQKTERNWYYANPDWSSGWKRPPEGNRPAPAPTPEEPGAPQQPGPAPAPGPVPAPDPGAVGLTADEQYLVSQINAERAAAGKAPLIVDSRLVAVGRQKARDMAENGYFDHYSPMYGSPFDMMRAAGIGYRWAGENIARASTVQVAHRALMESPGHRANILSSAYTHVGVGVVRSGGKVLVAQEFTKPR